MSVKIDHIYNSESGAASYQLASGYISETAILFEKEQIVAVIQAKGSVEFLNRDGHRIAAGSAPEKDSGRGVYEDVRCSVEGGLLVLRFPRYEWIDNYPNCDGEHDRWDTRIIGCHDVMLDPATGNIL